MSVGGYTWYIGCEVQSCDYVCANHGGCNLAGTRDYAGSGGTLANCQAALDALGYGQAYVLIVPNAAGFTAEDATGYAYGCTFIRSVNNYFNARYTSPETTCDAGDDGPADYWAPGGYVSFWRVRACNN